MTSKDRIVAFHNSHNSSVCEIKDKEIVYVQEAERLDGIKRSKNIEVLVQKYKNQHIEKIIYVTTEFDNDPNSNLLKYFLEKYNVKYDILKNYHKHHFFHACTAYYKSGFDQSYVLVADGGGKINEEKKEIFSCYYFKKNKYKKIFKLYKTAKDKIYNKKELGIDTFSIGNTFNFFKQIMNYKEPGSIMGLSSYSKLKEDNLFIECNNHFKISSTILYNAVRHYNNLELSSLIQKSSEKVILQYVKNIIKGKNRNLCVSGGVFQNTVINTKILNVCSNLYVDPFADDSGLSIGAALFELNKKEHVNKKINTLYLGDPADYSFFINKNSKNIDYQGVVKLIEQGNIIAIYQGRNELGKRALGNRSFLSDPRNHSAKEKINLLKEREWFRPTAGTVLYEHRNNWFDLKSKDETPFMSYVFKVKDNKNIPGITHVDNTCRVQTLKKEHNFHYYNLIDAFYKKTGVPILLNTSFNLAGQPLVNDGFQAGSVIIHDKNVELCNYIYLPELGKIYNKKDLK